MTKELVWVPQNLSPLYPLATMLSQKHIDGWLQCETVESTTSKYRHRLITEKNGSRQAVMPALRDYYYQAHEDARQRLRRLMGTSLDPLEEEDGIDPAMGYPDSLHNITLQGYFGETFAAIIAEFFYPFDIHDWKVPAFLFRFHNLAFEQLEELRLEGGAAGLIPGRTGDDNLAFQFNDAGEVTKVLCCESKCVTTNHNKIIANAHEKVGKAIRSGWQLVEILSERTDPTSLRWLNAIRRYWLGHNRSVQRFNLVTYICGNSPKRSGATTWISVSEPHCDYVYTDPLESCEIHLPGIPDLINQVYRMNEANSA
ncbi:MAG: hypothetical protein U0Y68_13440 [Blastocatellia bacterium]